MSDPRQSGSSAVKQALLRIEQLEQENARLRRPEPIAIVGMACRFPGGADTPGKLWDLLLRGDDAVREVPGNRWPVDRYYDADPDTPGTTYSRHGGFLQEELDLFDAAFFGIPPLEARSLDPQQRLLLEVSWEALENAGLAPHQLRGSRTGVFAGYSGSDYTRLHLHSGDPSRIGAYDVTGSIGSTAVGRVAYTFDFRGPAVAVDTACSSSLVAVDQACASLRQGASDLALAGGVSLILGPEGHVCFAKMKALSATGRCRTFDAAADGFVRGEGCGVVVLERLSDALAAGHPVLAVVRGSAVNQDGRSNGLTAPNLLAQRDVVLRALEQSGAAPGDVGYVEAHGTGTPLGDPIEIEALAGALCQGRQTPLWIGSVKTNLGHLETAAGVAGLIKLVLVLRHGVIPPHLHFQQPNPHIAWDGLPVRVPVETVGWDGGGRPRLGGVSSFGFGGTNAHVVVEAAPQQPEAPSASGPWLLCLSARSREALDRLAAGYTALLGEPETDPADVCAAANAGRSHFRHRLAVTGSSADELRRLLDTAGERGEAGDDPPRVVFLFTGQGSQRAGMGRELLVAEPRFRESLERCAALLAPHLDRPLLEVLESPELLERTDYAQPALFALEWSLAELWRAWGVEPAALAGHSVGEYVAACLAGVFGLEDTLALVAARGRLMQELTRPGRMLAVLAAEETVAEEILPWGDRLAIAAVNAPANVAVAGDPEAVEALAERCAARQIRTRALPGAHAFHSPLMDPVLPAFERAAAAVRYLPPGLRLVSNLTGDETADLTRPGYWVEHLRRPVRFAAGMRHLAAQGFDVFLEIGPAPTLSALGRQTAEGALWVPSLRRGRPERAQMLAAAGQLYVRGAQLDWPAVTGRPRRLPALPNYPFQRQRHWLDAVEPAPVPHVSHVPQPGEPMPTATRLSGDRPGDDRRSTVLATLRRIVADSSGLDAGTIDASVNLMELGLDSLMLMQVRQEVERRFGVEVPVSELFEGLNTLDRLAAYLAGRSPSLLQPEAPPAVAPAAPPPVPSGPISLSGTPIEQLMTQQLEAMSQLMARQLEALQGVGGVGGGGGGGGLDRRRRLAAWGPGWVERTRRSRARSSPPRHRGRGTPPRHRTSSSPIARSTPPPQARTMPAAAATSPAWWSATAPPPATRRSGCRPTVRPSPTTATSPVFARPGRR